MELGPLARLLMVVGAVVFASGVLLVVVSRLGLGRLPGDLHFRAGGTQVWIPLGTSLVISVVATVLLNFFFRR